MGDEPNMVAQILNLTGSSVPFGAGGLTNCRKPRAIVVPQGCCGWYHSGTCYANKRCSGTYHRVNDLSPWRQLCQDQARFEVRTTAPTAAIKRSLGLRIIIPVTVSDFILVH